MVQTFTSATALVTGIDVLVATFGRAADPAGELTLRVLDADTRRPLGQGRVAGDDLIDGGWAHVDLEEPVELDEPHAAFSVEWDGATPLAVWANTPRSDRRTALPNDPYPGGELRVGDQAPPGDLAFRVHGRGVAAVPGHLVEIVASAGNRLLEVPGFTVLWLLLLAASALLLWRPGRARSARRGRP